ncbi:MAG: TniQ family protein [Burkholderiales bacterium]|nr:TniQ family protein [Burkholderiales bacterium]
MNIQPLQGEYWASWVTRRFRLEGHMNQADGISSIPCAGDVNLHFHAPNLIGLRSLFGQQSQYKNIGEFLAQHTGLLAHMPTLAHDLRTLDRKRARAIDTQIRHWVARDLSRWGLVPTPKLCPQCASMDFQHHQVAYFHTEHQHGFSAVCAQHRVPLIGLAEVWRLNSSFPSAGLISELVYRAKKSDGVSGYDDAVQAALKVQSAGTLQIGENSGNRSKGVAGAANAPVGADRLQVKRISLVGLARKIDLTSRKLRLFPQYQRLPLGTAPVRAQLLQRRSGGQPRYSATLAALIRSSKEK